MQFLLVPSAEDSSSGRERRSRAGYFQFDMCVRNAAIVVSWPWKQKAAVQPQLNRPTHGLLTCLLPCFDRSPESII